MAAGQLRAGSAAPGAAGGDALSPAPEAERAAEVNRLPQGLAGANSKLAAVATHVVGRSGRQLLAALVAGERGAGRAGATGARAAAREDPQLEQALAGQVTAPQRCRLAQQLRHLDALEARIGEVSAEIDRRLQAACLDAATGEVACPFAGAVERLTTIPGVGQRTAEILLAEIGPDMGRCPSAAHLASWAGMGPGHHESAGQRQRGRTRSGSPWRRTALVEAAVVASRTKHTDLAAHDHRLAARRGKQRAALAVGHTIPVIGDHLLKDAIPYTDLGSQYFDERERTAVTNRLVRRLERLGHQVTLEANVA